MIRHSSAEAACSGASAELGHSISTLRKARKLHQQACCQALGRYGVRMTPAALSRWENGSNLPGCYQLLALSHALGQEGRMDCFLSQDTTEASPSPFAEAAGKAYADFLLHGAVREAPTRKPHMISFPVAENYASAGTGQPLGDDFFSMVSIPASSIPHGASFAVRISGDSMEPEYHNSQLVFVERTHQLYDGETGLFSLNGEGYIKQYRVRPLAPDPDQDEFSDTGFPSREVCLVSLNPAYQPIRVHEEDTLTVFGRIL